MFNKVEFVIRNKLIFLPNNELIYKCLDKNILISTIAREELVKRENFNTNLSDEILVLVIDKLSIEQIWILVSKNDNSKICQLAIQRLNSILDYYQKLNSIDYLNKTNEDNIDKIYLLK